MTDFDPNIREIQFAMDAVSSYDRPSASSKDNLAGDVIVHAGQFSQRVLAPLNRIGDSDGCRLVDGIVHVPPGFADAYRRYANAGWPGLEIAEKLGGQNMPAALAVAVAEIFNTANMALTMGMMPIPGAIDLIRRFGTQRQKDRFIPRILKGEATVTMAITEPNAGTDVGAITSAAQREGDGYNLRGQKSLITFGDHDMTADILHLVLARTPGAPPGSKGLSLFLVSKQLDGSQSGLNDISCISLEKKIGLRGSPTATLVFGGNGKGARAELLGKENAGLEQMFVLMNRARINVGVFGVSSAEGARQEALRYSRKRVQGRDSKGSPTTIGFHPDVRRMLMSMTVRTEAARYLSYYAASLLDRANSGGPPEVRARLDLLTPIAKAWCTEVAFDVTSLGVQIHGGFGYSEESAASQYFREARAHMIYEGTTGVQANDLMFRKILRDDGAAAKTLIACILRDVAEGESGGRLEIRRAGTELRSAVSELAGLVDWLCTCSPVNDAQNLQANGAHFLMLFGACAAGWLSLRSALFASAGSNCDEAFASAKAWNALFFAQQILPPAAALAGSLKTGAEAVLQMKA